MTTMRRLLSSAALALLGACSNRPPTADSSEIEAKSRPPTATASTSPSSTGIFTGQLQEIEAKSGGRLGVALHDADGRQVGGHRADERFAMCSTFKYALAAMVLADSATSKLPLDRRLSFRRSELVHHSPVVERHLSGESGTIRVADAARGAVVQSDNTASNLLLAQIGGPQEFTARIRKWGDGTTRLDRVEPVLNENAPGDDRDTTSPSAMAATVWRLAFGTLLPAPQREQLRDWGQQTETGRARIRHGLPRDWVSGDKTGSCGNAYNDIAWFVTPDTRRYTLTVYLDRPTVGADDANAAIASVARAAVQTISRR